jgi:hypothetical protein
MKYGMKWRQELAEKTRLKREEKEKKADQEKVTIRHH